MKKLLSTLLLSISLLTSCDGWFKPKTMTIEYDEEVKLHDGSMIWVHITRHYFYASEPSHGGAYMPSSVEISWDTGFKGVGRKSVYFRNVAFVSRENSVWKVFGFMPNSSSDHKNDSINCKNIGVKIGKHGCVVLVNKDGFSTDTKNINIEWQDWNILYPIQIKDWGDIPNPLNGKRISWDEKIELEKQQSESFRRINRHTQE